MFFLVVGEFILICFYLFLVKIFENEKKVFVLLDILKGYLYDLFLVVEVECMYC